MSQSSSPFIKNAPLANKPKAMSASRRSQGPMCSVRPPPPAEAEGPAGGGGCGEHSHPALSSPGLQSRFFAEGKVVSVGSRERVGG